MLPVPSCPNTSKLWAGIPFKLNLESSIIYFSVFRPHNYLLFFFARFSVFVFFHRKSICSCVISPRLSFKNKLSLKKFVSFQKISETCSMPLIWDQKRPIFFFTAANYKSSSLQNLSKRVFRVFFSKNVFGSEFMIILCFTVFEVLVFYQVKIGHFVIGNFWLALLYFKKMRKLDRHHPL